MSVSTLLCANFGLRCHRTTMVPLEVVVEVIQASRSFVQTLADANKVLTLLNAFTLLIVLALLGVIGVGVADGGVRAAMSGISSMEDGVKNIGGD
ncbi:unnamed protein product [Zymoseptoria tritici ST99CH_1E4]|uniref:Uncharacterized protein n=1 Tax=Zymoseptoria tritici ST99CH_1E4 TaxID=1276532 RepID=A0A2H1H9D6_ZYMTR|nr:unnamed protein product [Zymoseptoria tritici ST99CH_1E4]